MGTGGLTSSRSRIEEDGRSFIVAVPYGWRLADDAQHRRLEAGVNRQGRAGRVSDELMSAIGPADPAE